MLPMRSIPFKIICLVGMNNDAYPRDSKILDFDLISKYPRPGDRSRRNDDRYLFLETILSAREGLYISYTGQSIRDNSIIPPSVLVTELLDYIDRGFRIPGGKILDHIVTRHRLQAFNPEYFRKGSRLFSYSEENFRAARSLLGVRRAPSVFVHKGLSCPDEAWKKVRLDDLWRFFVNPARFLLERRLKVHFRKEEFLVEDVEPLEIREIEKYRLEQEIVKKRLAGWDFRDIFAVAKAGGALPHGSLGECVFDTLRLRAESFIEKSVRYMDGNTLGPFDFDVSMAGFRLTGTINDVYPAGLVQYRYARIRPTDRLKIWMRHLVLNSVRARHYPRTSILIGLSPNSKNPEWTALEYGPIENSEKILEDLLEKYREGLTTPLHFFPRSSWEYFQDVFHKDRSHEEAVAKARRIWMGNENTTGECEDPYYEVCFGNIDPLDAEFERISEEIFLPLDTNETEIEK
jgi:exodeoxyribonuclease V gamma subunit